MPIALPALRELNLLSKLPGDDLIRIVERLTERALSRREIVFSKGEASQYLYFLLEGKLQAVDFTVDGREVGLYFVDPGDYFGELSVIDEKPQAEYMVALAKSRIALLPRALARELILSSPAASEEVLTRVANRLREVSAQRTVLSLPNPAQRVCAQLVQLTATIRRGDPAVITQAPTHQEIAIMINTSRETVTRVFQVLQAKNVLKREGSQLAITDLRYLTEVAEGKLEPPKAS